MVRKKANFPKAINAAYQALEVHEIVDFPINLFNIFEDYDNLTVLSYKQIMESTGLTRQEVIVRVSSSEGSISYNAETDEYIIAYNEKIEKKRPKGRIYWTLAHEFGHYYLQHNKEKKQSRLSRLTLKKEDYDCYEAEADFFARFLLNPPSIIETYIPPKRLSGFFGVTEVVAKKTLNYITKTLKRGMQIPIPKSLSNQLFKFRMKLNNGKTCTECNTFFLNLNAKFCPICRNSTFDFFNKGEDLIMKYFGYELDPITGRPNQCPQCENEEVDQGEFCKICGIPVINKCTNKDLDYNNEIVWECGEIASGNARYCIKCGSPTTYYKYNLLSDWKDELPKEEEKVVTIETTEVLDALDDDLPF